MIPIQARSVPPKETEARENSERAAPQSSRSSPSIFVTGVRGLRDMTILPARLVMLHKAVRKRLMVS